MKRYTGYWVAMKLITRLILNKHLRVLVVITVLFVRVLLINHKVVFYYTCSKEI